MSGRPKRATEMTPTEYRRALAEIIRNPTTTGMTEAERADLASRGWVVGDEKPVQQDARTMSAAEFAKAKRRAIRG
jgi:hypothetical protein